MTAIYRAACSSAINYPSKENIGKDRDYQGNDMVKDIHHVRFRLPRRLLEARTALSDFDDLFLLFLGLVTMNGDQRSGLHLFDNKQRAASYEHCGPAAIDDILGFA